MNQIKIFPKKFSVNRTQDRAKNSFHARSAQMFPLKLLLSTSLSFFFHTFNNLFYTFLHPNHSIFRSEKLYWTRISSTCPASFSSDFSFDGTVRKSRKRLKIFTQVLWDMSTSVSPNHYSHSILIMFVAIFTF